MLPSFLHGYIERAYLGPCNVLNLVFFAAELQGLVGGGDVYVYILCKLLKDADRNTDVLVN